MDGCHPTVTHASYSMRAVSIRQDAYGIIRLTRSKAAARIVDDVARLIDFLMISYLFIYFLPSVAYDPEG